jgi:hypothetical protein
MPFDDAGFPDDGAKSTEPGETLWLRYSVAVLLILAIMVIPVWSLWRIAGHAIWSF